MPLLDWHPRTNADIGALTPTELREEVRRIDPLLLDDGVREHLDAAQASVRRGDLSAYLSHLRDALRRVYVLSPDEAAGRMWDALARRGPEALPATLRLTLPAASHRGPDPEAAATGDFGPDEVAAILAAYGVSVGPGDRGQFAIDGHPASVDEVGRLFADYLDIVADSLWDGVDAATRDDFQARARASAAGLRRSERRRRVLLGSGTRHALRRLVSPPADPSAASAWLSGFDRARAIRRPDLVRHYAIAGSPGGLDADGLRALADARWGAATKSHGYWTYHPARAL